MNAQAEAYEQQRRWRRRFQDQVTEMLKMSQYERIKWMQMVYNWSLLSPSKHPFKAPYE